MADTFYNPPQRPLPCNKLIFHAAFAMSLNGCIGQQAEQFSPLNGAEDHQRDLAQLRQLRTQMTGILIGHNTLKAYPKVHAVDRKEPPLVHAVMTRSGGVDWGLPLFQQTRHPVLILCPREPVSEVPEHIRWHKTQGVNCIRALLQKRYPGPWLIEGGGQALQPFWDAGLVEYLHLTVSPQWLQAGIPLFPAGWQAAYTLDLMTLQRLVNAVVLVYKVSVTSPAT